MMLPTGLFISLSRTSLLSSRRFFSTLDKWTNAVTELSPLEWESKSERRLRALLGDKILGMETTKAILENQNNKDMIIKAGSVSKIVSTSLSNAFMARHVDQILPHLNIAMMSDWEIGTEVEATVAEVYKRNDGVDSVAELVRFLTNKTLEMSEAEANPKSRLLNLGGSVLASSERDGKSSDHDPTYTAVASYKDIRIKAKGSSRKRAELTAALQVLKQIDVEDVPQLEELKPLAAPATLHQWEPFEVVDAHYLKTGQDAVQWWIKGASDAKSSFERAIMAPSVFHNIEAVDSWIRRSSQDHATVIMVIVFDDASVLIVPAQSAQSGTKARALLGLEANRMIASVVGLDIDGDLDD